MASKKRVPTGVDPLDRALQGGVPTGSLIVFDVSPRSQAELFLYSMTDRAMSRDNRSATYLTTERSRSAVRAAYSRLSPESTPTIESVDARDPVEDATTLAQTSPEEGILVIDTVNVLEETDDKRAYREFLNSLQTHMQNTGGIAILYCLSGVNTPEARDITHNMADLIFMFETEKDGTEVTNQLWVPKFRGGEALKETFGLIMTAETVTVDTSETV
jgi:KaiC/GvpD/RAD55 family RecA-like ATPase